MDSFIELTGALGASHPDQLTPAHILHRMPNEQARNYAQLYPYLGHRRTAGIRRSTGLCGTLGRRQRRPFLILVASAACANRRTGTQ